MSASCFKSKNLAKVNLKFDVQNNFTGIYYIKLEALQDDSYLVSGQYKTCCNQLTDVHIGLVICTYKREKFIENNLQLLKQNILCNIDSPLCNNLHVFISDNGQTLDITKLSTDKIHIFSNKNTGGSGGFTRGLVEIINNESSLPITHALLMDDDVEIEPESLVRTFNFLRLVKDEYKDIHIGGAMLSLDEKYMQTTGAEIWNGYKNISPRANVDLRDKKEVVKNELEYKADYNGWWYMCIPRKYIEEDNLPLPLFIKLDDVEYGIRNIETLINLNGICVWHEPFKKKENVHYTLYYSIRNMLIINKIHPPSTPNYIIALFLTKKLLIEIVNFRFKNMALIIRAILDSFRGLEWLYKLDAEKHHKKIIMKGNKS